MKNGEKSQNVCPYGPDTLPPVAPHDILCSYNLGMPHLLERPIFAFKVWRLAPHASKRAKDANSIHSFPTLSYWFLSDVPMLLS